MAKIPVAGPPNWWRALTLWVLIQMIGAVLFVLIIGNLLAHPATNSAEPLDNLGYGFAIVWVIQWVLTNGFIYALPLLVLLPIGIKLVIRARSYRHIKLLGLVLGLELTVVASEAWEISIRPTIFLGKIAWVSAFPIVATLALPYILTALLMAWLLYRPWLRKANF